MNTTQITSLPVAFHPGETLSEKLQEMEVTIREFAERSQVPECIVQGIINGEESISADMAIAFETVTGIPAKMWIRSQHHYDEYILTQKRSSYMERLLELSHRVAAVL